MTDVIVWTVLLGLALVAGLVQVVSAWIKGREMLDQIAKSRRVRDSKLGDLQ